MNFQKRKSSSFSELHYFKTISREIADHFLSDGATDWDGYRISECAKIIRSYNSSSGGVFLDPLYCKHPHCPQCQKNNAKKYRSQIHHLLDEYPELLLGNWMFLTLTVRNCDVDDLGSTIDSMTDALDRLKRRKFWKKYVLGGIRFLEVTERQRDRETVHPHFHILLLVRPSMFAGNNYVSTNLWAKHWQKALSAHYEPMVHVKRFKGDPSEMRSRIVSHAGYSLKPRTKVLDRRRFLVLTDQMRNRNRVRSFGVVRKLLSELRGQTAFDAIEQQEEARRRHEPKILTWDEKIAGYKPL
ncbi:hypothetical protein DXI23_19585 [Marinobacter flavimaris]|jgi:hypothetical protein|uniref:Uncharacterized protein n=1 Tax=Marinobacter flavimaris TaxID=262076 RepID=A0A3D8GXQ7_9GAMM|nr:protein rep [Marinobacter flavimaris]PPI78613.1 hypothetical protein MDHKLMBL_19345 [Marinobacter flavimaris]RDU39237.1 hypothetical protein DXI23_19585 [Marinobacter flavimaris]